MSKQKLNKIVEELKNASKTHAGQAKKIKTMIKNGPFKMKLKSPIMFKGANSKNSKCWPGKKKVGTKPSPSRPGVTVNDCR